MSQLESNAIIREADAGGTTSATYANTTTLLPSTEFVAGKRYLLFARAEISMNQTQARGGIRLVHGTTAFDGSDQQFTPTFNIAEWSPWFHFVVWTAVAGESVAIQTRGNGVARCDYRWATIAKVRLDDSGLVEGTDWLYDEVTTDTVLTTTLQTGAQLTWTPGTGAEQWLIISRSRLLTDFGPDEYVTRLDRTGEATANWEMMAGGRIAGDARVWPVMNVLTLGAVSQTFKEQSRRNGTGGTTATRNGSALLALRLARFDVVSVISTDGHTDPVDTPQYGTQVATVNHTQVVDQGKALILAQVALDPADNSAIQKFFHARLQRANADEFTSYSTSNGGRTHYPNQGDSSPTQVWPWTHCTLRTLDAGAAAYDLDVSVSAAAAGRGVKFRRIVVISLDVTAAPGGGGSGAAFAQERNDQKMYLFDYRAARRRVRVRLTASDGSAITTAAGTQGAISKNGAAFTTTGVGVLVNEESSNGLYYAELTAAALNELGSYRFRVTASGVTATVVFAVEENPWLYDGLATGGGANYVDLSSPPSTVPAGAIAQIMDGPGVGESMLVDSFSTPRVTMEDTWVTTPTSSSFVIIRPGLKPTIPDANIAAIDNDQEAASNLAQGASALKTAAVVAGANSPTQIVCNIPAVIGGSTQLPNYWKDRGIVIRDADSPLDRESAIIIGSSVSGANTVLVLDPNAALSATPAVGTTFVVT